MDESTPRSSLLSPPVSFRGVDWRSVPDQPGAYVIYDDEEVIYVGMAGRDRSGSLRRRLRDHASGQIVNMFAQYLFLARVQFISDERARHPHQAKAAVRSYLVERCAFRFATAMDGADARRLEQQLKSELKPVLNP
ncbi:GIY-YIG nuclease family protein [Sorangium sp. So ce176]|uniref:GIY-YIG nuclease family protein n=1 Tax=Sorangium sp. So ce176 TaxID=3133286 RepID=UPI003F62C5DE